MCSSPQAVIWAISPRYARIAIWSFTTWGFSDPLLAFYQGPIDVGIEPTSLGAES
jgi:hypothetical protein